jgi:hypothetical protein
MPEADVRLLLFGWPDAATGAPIPSEDLPRAFEQYKLYLELTDRLSQRRQTANSFFLTLNTAVVTLLGYANAVREPIRAERFYLLISFTGVALCILWYLIIRSYRDINAARFAVIRALESLLLLRPYTAEWDFLWRLRQSKYYRPSYVEGAVPWLFFVLYAIVLLWNIPWLVLFGRGG